MLAMTGCFYVQPINQRPSADIIQVSSAAVYRGETNVELDASTYDPEGQSVHVQWRVYACTDATQVTGCDDAPFHTDLLADMFFDVPPFRADMSTPTAALRVILEAADEHGATAKPDQELLIPIEDAAPTIQLSSSMRRVVSTPIDVFAQVDDPDDGFAAVLPTIEAGSAWQVFTPSGQMTYTLAAYTSTADPKTIERVLTPTEVGDYDLQVTVTDPAGEQTIGHLPLTIVQDTPPCLEQWAPLAPPAGDAMPMQDPTLFQVLYVQDDLDPYPAVTGDPVMGTTSFAWTLLPPGATQRQSLDVVGNSVALDPANYKPGDVLELRVEVADRNHTPVNCPDSEPTCSVISDPTCIQRLTWRVEVQ